MYSNLRTVASITFILVTVIMTLFFNNVIDLETTNIASTALFVITALVSLATYWYTNKPTSNMQFILFAILAAAVVYIAGDVATYATGLTLQGFDHFSFKVRYHGVTSLIFVLTAYTAYVKLRDLNKEAVAVA